MPGLNEYLVQKRAALLKRREGIDAGEVGIHPIRTQARAESRSGIRRIRIRDFQIISDSPPSFAGYDLGPGSPEILLGSLSSCLVHTWLIHAADQQLPLEDLEVEVNGQMDARAGRPGFEDVPVHPHEISYRVKITSPADRAAVAAVEQAVLRFCPVLNLLSRATEVRGEVVLTHPAA
ncbi:OsmC family protein [Paenirhodobacter sp.]|uniref:OsmC family protein n=1 Tax=Paenirhodobacter sp. TaxID=1965326 RepID=UPI003B3FE2B3